MKEGESAGRCEREDKNTRLWSVRQSASQAVSVRVVKRDNTLCCCVVTHVGEMDDRDEYGHTFARFDCCTSLCLDQMILPEESIETAGSSLPSLIMIVPSSYPIAMLFEPLRYLKCQHNEGDMNPCQVAQRGTDSCKKSKS